ncbi:hypothetical protein ACFQ41_05185 [Lacticaseibacillus suilingensis]|uniref:Uncharacterized protein n=1 Tax=Lacticaseibacillus suilingensis TaxID=2799577 RepID=A0ABW4BEI9_9LACO|nr:hypothetical protein [Lacticaseibacillus suilingensis]
MRVCKTTLALAAVATMVAMMLSHSWQGIVMTTLAAIMCIEVLTGIEVGEIAERMEAQRG